MSSVVGPVRERARRLRQRLIGPELARIREQVAELDYEQRVQQRLLRVALGQLMASEIAGRAVTAGDAQYGAFSQFGEDGIIEYLIRNCDLTPEVFVEIGVETYAEANTRFLAENRLWRGLVVDQNPQLAEDVAATQLHWRSQLSTVSSFVTRENIRHIVQPFIGSAGLGLLSLDIDGIDYFILEQLIDLTPALVIVEYNALFGAQATVTVPYDPAFDRTLPARHNIHYGVSLGAWHHLLAPRGYVLVCCSTAGSNAFFVRGDRRGGVPEQSVSEAFRSRRFVEHRELSGRLTGRTERLGQLADVRGLPLLDVHSGVETTVGREFLGD